MLFLLKFIKDAPFSAGFASYYQPRQNNDAQNQQHPDLLPVQEMEEGHALQGRQYAGVQESIV